MNCERAKDRFSEMIEGSVAPSMRVAVENHLRECAGCREEYALFGKTWETLGHFAPVELPDALHDRIIQRVDAYEWAKSRSQPPAWKLWLTRGLVAGSAVCTLGFFYLLLPTSSESSVKGGFIFLGPNKSAVNPPRVPVASQSTQPTLEIQRQGETSTPIVRFSTPEPTQYTLAISGDASRFDSRTARATVNASSKANSQIETPIVPLAGQESTVVWLQTTQRSAQQLSVFFLPSPLAGVSRAPGFTAPLTETLNAIALRYKTPIQLDSVQLGNPVVVLNDYRTNALEAVNEALNGTPYKVIEASAERILIGAR